MSIMLGNVDLSTIEKRTGINIPKDLRKKLQESHQDSASDIQNGKWHCFDIPFVLVCGGEELFNEVKDALVPMGSEFKERLGITYTKEATP